MRLKKKHRNKKFNATKKTPHKRTATKKKEKHKPNKKRFIIEKKECNQD